MTKITVSIVTYKNNYSDIIKVIHSFMNCNNKFKIIIIDNSPTNELEKIELIPDVEYIFNNKNLGFGAGHNIAINKTILEEIEYHLVLNPDVYFDSEVIDKILSYMDQNRDIGLVMPKIKYPDNQTQYLCKLLATPIDLVIRRFIPISKWISKRNNRYELRFTDYETIMQIPSLSGCFMLLRTDVLKKIGGFDERFFMYCEDFDLCRRIGQVSKTVFYPEVSIIHNYGKGSYDISILLLHHISSAFKYFNKWGWFFDKDRRRINKETLQNLHYYDHCKK